MERFRFAATGDGDLSANHHDACVPRMRVVLLDADCIMTCRAIVPTAELGVLFEMPKQRGSHWTRRWREMDSNFWYRGTKTVDSRSIPRIAGIGRTLARGGVKIVADPIRSRSMRCPNTRH
jgi:hypothetical protein